jgi:hypothetical protein
MLIEMYQGVAVDGSSAYIRGHEEEEEGDDATLVISPQHQVLERKARVQWLSL